MENDGVGCASIHLLATSVDRREGDDIILNVIAPLVTSLREQPIVQRWFFIRYGDPAHHLRLRVFGPEVPLRSRVMPAMEDWIDSRLGPERRLWEPYVPETARYGGAWATAEAECLFEASSELCVDLLSEASAIDDGMRTRRAIASIVALVHAFVPERPAAHRLLTAYERENLDLLPKRNGAFHQRWPQMLSQVQHRHGELVEQISTMWSDLDASSAITPGIAKFVERSRAVSDTIRALERQQRLVVGGRAPASYNDYIGGVVPSLIHMMNNRLGLSRPEEAYVAGLIHRSIAS